MSDFAKGQRVRALQALTQDADDELPAQHLCNKGDELEIREVFEGCLWPLKVAHPHMPADKGFCVTEEEIEAVS